MGRLVAEEAVVVTVLCSYRFQQDCCQQLDHIVLEEH